MLHGEAIAFNRLLMKVIAVAAGVRFDAFHFRKFAKDSERSTAVCCPYVSFHLSVTINLLFDTVTFGEIV